MDKLKDLGWVDRWNEAWFEGWQQESPKGVLLFGARQTGKSSLIRRVQARSRNSILCNYASPRVLNEHRIGLEPFRQEILEARRAPGRVVDVFVDEAPRNPAVFDLAQELMDEYPGAIRFVLTGSSARQLLGGSANRLPGRVLAREMWPLALGEIASTAPLASEIRDAMVHGLLPEVFSRARTTTPTARAEILSTYSALYVGEEIEQENLVRSPEIFSRFLPLAAAEAGGLLNFKKLASQIGTAPQTVKRFFEILVATKVAFYLPPYVHGHERAEVILTPKIYWFDNGVRNALASRPLHPGLLNLEGGLLFEHLMVQEARKTIAAWGTAAKPARMHYWRSHNGKEVDLVITVGMDRLFLFEFKFKENLGEGDLSGVRTFLDSRISRARSKGRKAQAFLVAPVPRNRLIGKVPCLTVPNYLAQLRELLR